MPTLSPLTPALNRRQARTPPEVCPRAATRSFGARGQHNTTGKLTQMTPFGAWNSPAATASGTPTLRGGRRAAGRSASRRTLVQAAVVASRCTTVGVRSLGTCKTRDTPMTLRTGAKCRRSVPGHRWAGQRSRATASTGANKSEPRTLWEVVRGSSVPAKEDKSWFTQRFVQQDSNLALQQQANRPNRNSTFARSGWCRKSPGAMPPLLPVATESNPTAH